MRETLKQNTGFIQIPLLITIVTAFIVVGGASYGIIEYQKISKIINEAEQLSKNEKYSEAIEKLELAKNRWLTKNLGIKGQEIADKIENNRKLSEDKSEYNKGLEEFNKGNYEKAKELLEKVSEISPYYQDAKNKIEEVQEKITEKKIAEAVKQVIDKTERELKKDEKRETKEETGKEIMEESLQKERASPSCVDECSYLGQKQCEGSILKSCGNYDTDECLEWRNYQYCEYGCALGKCNPAPYQPQYNVETLIVDYKDASAIKVVISGDKKSLTAILSGPDKSTVDTEYISENDMLDGGETVWLHFQRYAESNPEPGLYTLIVKETWGGREIYRKEFNIKGPKPVITGYSLKWKLYWPPIEEYGYQLDNYKASFTIKNEGDLTTYIRGIDILLNGEELVVPFGNVPSKKKILPGETTEISVGYSDIVDKGTYTMEVRLVGQVNGELTTLASYTATISVP
ncbi:MAG: hypothetical protein J7L26_01565 [Candidatus Aminicenantes bacterium]|nr:hypothetical protein [Candidatus Aminicenantes bacterium]